LFNMKLTQLLPCIVHPWLNAPRFITVVSKIALATALCACASAANGAAGEWQTLFDGRDPSAWRTFGKPANEPVAWAIEDGALAWRKGAGNLVTKESYRDFELELEWKISPGGNSGIMFRIDPAGARPPQTGPEIQILDDAGHKDGASPLTSAGSLYGLYAPLRSAAKPVGEWNTARLRVQGNRVQHWLNGQLVVDVAMGTPEWNRRVADSKFARFPNFGRIPSGPILLQDHNDPVWFRKIRIRQL
jgi:hypothetical protein